MIAFSAWIVLGLVAGFIAHMISHDKGERFGLDIFLGLSGALMGGWIVTAFGYAGVMGLNMWSILVSLIAATILLIGFHTIISEGETLSI
jgi:uncharacterized membrane protein YeaQ/YmgE (transglycosylase-associated protein family)